MSKTLGGGTGRILSLYTPSAMVGDLHPIEPSTYLATELDSPMGYLIAWAYEVIDEHQAEIDAEYAPVTDEERRQSDQIDADAQSEARYGTDR